MAVLNLGSDSSGRPLRMDDRTRAKLDAAEDRLGVTFTVVQGSYMGRAGGAQASAGTHDGGGVIDIRTWDLDQKGTTIAKAVEALRRAGLIAWFRTKAQGFDPHIHAIDYGSTTLAPSAARQVAAWEAGRNGLASNGPDDGPRGFPVPKSPPTPKLARPAPERTPEQMSFTENIDAAKRHLRAAISQVADRSNASRKRQHWRSRVALSTVNRIPVAKRAAK